MQVAMKHTRPHDAYIKMLNDITFSLVFQATSATFRSNDMMATFREWKKKKKKGFDNQNKTFSCASHFLYISLPFLHDCSMKMPNFTFYGEHKQAATIFDKVSREE